MSVQVWTAPGWDTLTSRNNPIGAGGEIYTDTGVIGVMGVIGVIGVIGVTEIRGVSV